MSKKIDRINQVTAIVRKHMDLMISEVWNALPSEQNTRDMGAALGQAEEDLTRIIMNELITINACD